MRKSVCVRSSGLELQELKSDLVSDAGFIQSCPHPPMSLFSLTFRNIPD